MIQICIRCSEARKAIEPDSHGFDTSPSGSDDDDDDDELYEEDDFASHDINSNLSSQYDAMSVANRKKGTFASRTGSSFGGVSLKGSGGVGLVAADDSDNDNDVRVVHDSSSDDEAGH